jgi:hypothetical protein
MIGNVPCTLTCEGCGRSCHDGPIPNQTHRIDCCGIAVGHVPVVAKLRIKGKVERTYRWVRRGTEAGYLVGLPTSKPISGLIR